MQNEAKPKVNFHLNN